jgi:hypothetical protein
MNTAGSIKSNTVLSTIDFKDEPKVQLKAGTINIFRVGFLFVKLYAFVSDC